MSMFNLNLRSWSGGITDYNCESSNRSSTRSSRSGTPTATVPGTTSKVNQYKVITVDVSLTKKSNFMIN